VRATVAGGCAALALLLAACSSAEPTAAPPSPETPSATFAGSPRDSGWSPEYAVRATGRVAYVVGRDALWKVRDSVVRAVAVPSARGPHGRALRIRQLVFLDARHGYAILGTYGIAPRTVALATDDGALSWHVERVPSHVVAVAGHGRRVYAATLGCERRRCTTTRILTTTTGSHRWRDTGARLPAIDSSSGVGLGAWRSSVWVLLGVGSTSQPPTLHSTDGARTFATIGHVNATFCTGQATSARVLWASCGTGMMMAFHRLEAGQPIQDLAVHGAGTGGTFLDPVDDRVAYFGSPASQRPVLQKTTDGGRHFLRVAPFPPALARSANPTSITFLTASTGLAVRDGRAVFRTTDGGHTWRRIRPTAPARS
jgi:hypothetical protein